MALIFLLSSLPGDELKLPDITGIDKVGHFFLYALLALVAIHAFRPLVRIRRTGFAVFIILFCLFYGISDEFHQFFVPFRNSSAFDLIADTLGSSTVVLVWLLKFSDLRPPADTT